MPQVKEPRVATQVEHLPTIFRSRTVDYTLLIVGAIIAAFGVYTYYAPADWLWAGLEQGWYLGSFVLGGAFLTAGFAILGASLRDRAGYWTNQAIGSFLLATVALVGAVVAAVVWII